MNFPKITIITPTYNCVQDLEQSIQSVLVQEYPNLEYIIIDGESRDGTVEVIQKYASKLSYWVSEPDQGIYDAMNKGLEKASGDWIYFLGADDSLCSGVLHKLFGESLSPSTQLIYGQAWFKNKGYFFGEEYDLFTLYHKNICHQAIFYHFTLFNTIGNYDLQYKVYADWELNFRAFTHPQIKVEYRALCIAQYNELGYSSKNQDLFNLMKAQLFYPYLVKLGGKKKTYEMLGDSIFTLFRTTGFFRAWYHLLEAAFFLKKPRYYLQHGWYWSKQYLSR